MVEKISLHVDGKSLAVTVDADTPLLYVLRDELKLNNPHFGCGLAQCGACTVHVDGQPTRSCVTPLSAVGQAKIVTLAGLGTPEKPHPLQTAYVEEQVPQCGYCINGWLMTAAAFLRDKKKPSEAEIQDALSGLKCRCGTHISILKAVKRAAEMMGQHLRAKADAQNRLVGSEARGNGGDFAGDERIGVGLIDADRTAEHDHQIRRDQRFAVEAIDAGVLIADLIAASGDQRT